MAGRKKGRVEKISATDYSREELQAMFRHGVGAQRRNYLALGELRDELWNLVDDSLEDDEEFEMLYQGASDVDNFAEGVDWAIWDRIRGYETDIEELEEEIREIQSRNSDGRMAGNKASNEIDEIQGEIRKLQKQLDQLERIRLSLAEEIHRDLHNDSPLAKTKLFDSQSWDVLKRYFLLQERLGRIPFRSELEASFRQKPVGKTSPEACLKKITRLHLPLGDKRILARLENSLFAKKDEVGSEFCLEDHVVAICDGFDSLGLNTPETQRLKRRLQDAPFGRLLEICGNATIANLVRMRVSKVLFADGVPVVWDDFLAKGLVTVPRVKSFLQGSEKAFGLYSILRALCLLWNRCNPGGFDTSWIGWDRESDYSAALNWMILADYRREVREVIPWIIGLTRSASYRELLRNEICGSWAALGRQEGYAIVVPIPDFDAGLDLVLRGLNGRGSLPSIACGDFAAQDPDLKKVVDFLEPFDWCLKGLDYGLPPPAPRPLSGD